jgi:Fe-S oxidoreductase
MAFASTGVSEELIKQGETREVFWQFPLWLELFWYVLALASVAVFAYGVARPIAKYRRGKGSGWPPVKELPHRFWDALRIMLAHVTIRKRDGYAGLAHMAIFYGFITLFIGTVILAINTDVTERIFGWRFFKGDFYLVYSFVLDVMGVALLLGVLAMMFRRAVIRPRKLDYGRPDREPGQPGTDRSLYRRGDWVFVGGLLYLVLTGYLLEGARIAMDVPGNERANPAGWLAGEAMAVFSTGTLEVLRHVIWWSHGLVALAFVAAIPYTKATHMLTSFASLVLRDPRAGKRLRRIPPEKADQPAGYTTLEDFSPVHLLHLDACTKCGKCHEACPANNTGRPLSPRDVILELREGANARWNEVGIGGVLGTLIRGDTDGELRADVVDEYRIRPETVWACYQCNACVEACPVGIEQAPIINQMRRSLVEKGELPSDLQSTLQVITKSGNSFGENRKRRGRWTKELDFEIPDARKEPVDMLWFVGDYASFDPRSQEISRVLARLYQAAGVDFGILYDGERNAGNDVRRAGEEGLWEALAEENIETLRECEFNRIVTSDPHSLNTIRNEYPELGAEWPVTHHTTFLLELLENGKLKVQKPLSYRVTYHDPCHLGRFVGEYDAPRKILELLGCELVEMPRNRDNSFCCGAGGGRIWIRDEPGQERPSENRIREAVSLGELDFFVVTCPKDVTMYEDAIKTTGNGDRLALRELTELLEEACIGVAPEPEPVPA